MTTGEIGPDGGRMKPAKGHYGGGIKTAEGHYGDGIKTAEGHKVEQLFLSPFILYASKEVYTGKEVYAKQSRWGYTLLLSH